MSMETGRQSCGRWLLAGSLATLLFGADARLSSENALEEVSFWHSSYPGQGKETGDSTGGGNFAEEMKSKTAITPGVSTAPVAYQSRRPTIVMKSLAEELARVSLPGYGSPTFSIRTDTTIEVIFPGEKITYGTLSKTPEASFSLSWDPSSKKVYLNSLQLNSQDFSIHVTGNDGGMDGARIPKVLAEVLPLARQYEMEMVKLQETFWQQRREASADSGTALHQQENTIYRRYQGLMSRVIFQELPHCYLKMLDIIHCSHEGP